MRGRRMVGARDVGPGRWFGPPWNAEPGKRAGQRRGGPQPDGGLQWLPESGLARLRVDHRAAGRVRVDVLADPPVLLAWPGGYAGNRVDDGVPRAEGGIRRRGAQQARAG